MKIITQRQLIQTVANKWRAQYEPFKDETPLFSVRHGWKTEKTKEQTAKELDVLDKDNATPQDVAEIIGNDSWTKLNCDECGSFHEAVLCIGESAGYETRSIQLCRACVGLAAEHAALFPPSPTARNQGEI